MVLQESGEMYLETILVLSENGASVRSIDVAEHMNYSKPSVSRAMGLLRQGGYIVMDKSGYITLTESGKQVAETIYERHVILSEFLKKIGVDPETLSETVDNYNDYCDGRDEEFFKNYRFLKKLKKGPFYAATVRPGGYGTVGGIRINENCEVCDKEFAPIPGLYAAGADSCNIYDDSYMFLLPGNSMGYAVNTGRIAGSEAAEYVEE